MHQDSPMNISPSALYGWYRDTIRNPKYRLWIVAGTLAYLLSPIDIAPDFLPIAGQLDDLAIVTLLIAELSQIAIEWFKNRPTVKSANAASVADTAVDVSAVNLDG